LRRYFEDFGVYNEERSMIMTELDGSNCLPVVLDRNLLLVLLAYLQKAHIDERLKEYLTFHLVDSHRQFYSESILANNLDDLSLIFKFLALVFDFGGGGQA
jgi:predicted PolB exonuclease-like 3'-5' exonuclease